jgi:DNA-binding SARP family transcriptional activator
VDDRVATPLCVLGPLEVRRGGEHVRLGSGQQRRLLAVLAVHANEVVSTDRLVDALWGEQVPRSASHTLQGLVSRLRNTLGDDRVETCPPGYRLRVANGELDASRFEELVRVGLGAPERAEAALAVFDEALGMWRGSPYVEFAGEEFATAEVARLVELQARAIEERAAALLELGRPEDVIGELEAQIAVEPFSRASAGTVDGGARAGGATGRITTRLRRVSSLPGRRGRGGSLARTAGTQRRRRAPASRRLLGGIASTGHRHLRVAVSGQSARAG